MPFFCFLFHEKYNKTGHIRFKLTNRFPFYTHTQVCWSNSSIPDRRPRRRHQAPWRHSVHAARWSAHHDVQRPCRSALATRLTWALVCVGTTRHRPVQSSPPWKKYLSKWLTLNCFSYPAVIGTATSWTDLHTCLYIHIKIQESQVLLGKRVWLTCICIIVQESQVLLGKYLHTSLTYTRVYTSK